MDITDVIWISHYVYRISNGYSSEAHLLHNVTSSVYSLRISNHYGDKLDHNGLKLDIKHVLFLSKFALFTFYTEI